MKKTKRKRCSQCKKLKDAKNGFYRKSRGKPARRPECKECTKQNRSKYYHDNLPLIIERKAKQRIRDRQWLQNLKGQLACKGCGEDDSRCLDFHHRDPKKKSGSIGNAIRQGWSRRRILDEIKKCDVLCANCHRKKHHSQRNGN